MYKGRGGAGCDGAGRWPLNESREPPSKPARADMHRQGETFLRAAARSFRDAGDLEMAAAVEQLLRVAEARQPRSAEAACS